MKIFNGRGILRGSVDYSSILAWLNSSAFDFGGFTPAFELDFVENPKTAQEKLSHERAGNAMMRNSAGEWVWAPHNLLTWSEDFTKSTWLKSGVTVTDDADGFDLLVPASSGSDKFVYRQVSFLVPAVQNTVAIKVKPSGKSVAYITHVGGSPASACYFDLVAGTAHLGNYGSDPFIIPQDDGSYLCGYTRPSNATWYEVGCCDAVGSTSVTVNGSDGVLISGAHLYRSDMGGMADNPATGNSYVPTTDAPVYLPRIGHHEWNGSEWVNKGLLVEKQATNFLKYSEDFSNSIWVARGFTKAGPASGPMGATAYEFVEDGTSTNPAIYYNADATDGTPRAFSIWLKASTPVTIALTTQSDTKSREINVTTEWKFFWVSDSLNAAIGPHIGGFSTISVGSGLRIWAAMPQQEDAPTPSSYIPTNGSAVTRAADVMTQPAGTLPWPTGNALTIGMSGEANGDAFDLISWQDDASNYLSHSINTTDLTFEQSASGVVDSVTGGAFSGPFTYCSTHASTFVAAAVNGTALATNTTPTELPDLSATEVDLLPKFNGTVKWITYWDKDIGSTGRLEGSSNG